MDDNVVRSKPEFLFKRCEYLDQLKGLSIICITLLHFESGLIPTGLNAWIGSFMVAAFYFTSGWLMGLKGMDKLPTLRELACKRCRSLGLPYIWFSLVILIFDIIWILLGFDEWRTLGRDVYKTLTLRGIGTLWFLPALFFGELIFVWIIRKKIYWQIGALVLTLGWYWGYGKWAADFAFQNDLFRVIDAPLRSIQNILSAWPIIMFSFYISKLSASKILLLNKALVCFAGVILVFLSYWGVNCSLGISSSIVIMVKGWVVSVLGSFALLLIYFAIYNFPLNAFFSYWGRNSLILMSTHFSIYQVICESFCSRVLLLSEFVGWVTITCFILTMMVEYPTVWMINKWFPFFLGKRKESHA